MTERVQLVGVIAMTLVAMAILALLGYVTAQGLANISPDGKVPIADAGLFTALLLSFREVLTVIRSMWDAQERTEATAALSNSTPTLTPNPPADPPVGEAPAPIVPQALAADDPADDAGLPDSLK